LYNKPVKVKIEQHFTRSAQGGVGFPEPSGNYGGSFLATRKAVQEGFQQVLWTDHADHAYLEEAGTMNVAFVLDGTLVTPALSDRILDGITRDSILVLAREWGIPVEERRISVEEIVSASKDGRLHEAFGMGTAAVVSPIDGLGYHDEIMAIPAPMDGLAMRVKQALSDIRYGRATDTHGWMTKI